MRETKKTNIQISYMVLDVLVSGISLYLGLLLHYENEIPQRLINDLVIIFPVAASALLFTGFVFGCYECVLSYAGISEILRQLGAVFLAYLFLMGLRYFGLTGLPGSVLINGMIFAFLMTGGIRVSSRILRWYTVRIRKKKTKRTLVIGAGASAAMLIKRMHEADWNGLYPIAVLDDNPQKLGMRLCGVKVVGGTENIGVLARKYRAEMVLIAIPSADSATLKRLFDRVSGTGLPIKMIRDMVDIDDYFAGNQHALKDISIEDLLFRSSVKTDMGPVREYIAGKTVLITGGAGSIGSELCRQVLKYGCGKLVIFDIDENGLFEINEELKQTYEPGRYDLKIGSIRDEHRVDQLFRHYRPEMVFHAAAHKHVPMMEMNTCEAIKNNIIGTKNVIDACKRYGVAKFILISTDKAVNSASVMGATKRVAELLVRAESSARTEMAAVRFGNVLGSNGSVVPTFRRQIENGGPVTVTDPEMRRYFMTIEEAVSLVLHAAAQAHGGEIFVLDMGKPVKIYDLARDLIRLSGYEPGRDIEITFTGVRPGEKLFEELRLDWETLDQTSHEKIFVMRSEAINQILLHTNLAKMKNNLHDEAAAKICLFDMVRSTTEKEFAYSDVNTVVKEI